MDELNKTQSSAEEVAQNDLHEASVVEGENNGKKKAVCRKDMTKAQWTWKEMKRNKVAYFMIAPFMLVFILFTAFPVVLSLLLSFTNFNMLEINADMIVWFDNYTRLFFDDDIFLLACKNTLIFAAITGHCIFTLHSGKRKITFIHKAVIKAFAFGGQKVKTVFIIVHNINSTGHGQSVFIYSCNNSRMYLLH